MLVALAGLAAGLLLSDRSSVIVRTADEDGIDPPYWREAFRYIADHVR
jgi:hypothetical protein